MNAQSPLAPMLTSQDFSRRLTKLSPPARGAILARLEWLKTARPSQIVPPGDWWDTWLLQAGRGFGKTRVGSETAGIWGLGAPSLRIAVVAPTHDQLRKVCFEGESGLMKRIPEVCIARDGKRLRYDKSLMQIVLWNGTIIQGYSADSPERLRGPQHHYAWCDEVGSWRYAEETWNQLILGLRLGTFPKTVVTTTPFPSPFMIKLNQQLGKRMVMTRGSTFENTSLSEAAVTRMREMYEGTRLGRQELYAELLTDIPGALWTLAALDASRRTSEEFAAQTFKRVVVAIDPAVSTGIESALTGVVVCGLGHDGTYWIIEDQSGQYSPDEWAGIALALYDKHHADRIIGEVNNGGDLIETVIRHKRPNASYRAVRATRGKYRRAEPISALWEQGKGRINGAWKELEEQMRTYLPHDPQSPDRLDAMVWGMTDLLETVATPRLGMPLQVGAAR